MPVINPANIAANTYWASQNGDDAERTFNTAMEELQNGTLSSTGAAFIIEYLDDNNGTAADKVYVENKRLEVTLAMFTQVDGKTFRSDFFRAVRASGLSDGVATILASDLFVPDKSVRNQFLQVMLEQGAQSLRAPSSAIQSLFMGPNGPTATTRAVSWSDSGTAITFSERTDVTMRQAVQESLLARFTTAQDKDPPDDIPASLVAWFVTLDPSNAQNLLSADLAARVTAGKTWSAVLMAKAGSSPALRAAFETRFTAMQDMEPPQVIPASMINTYIDMDSAAARTWIGTQLITRANAGMAWSTNLLAGFESISSTTAWPVSTTPGVAAIVDFNAPAPAVGVTGKDLLKMTLLLADVAHGKKPDESVLASLRGDNARGTAYSYAAAYVSFKYLKYQIEVKREDVDPVHVARLQAYDLANGTTLAYAVCNWALVYGLQAKNGLAPGSDTGIKGDNITSKIPATVRIDLHTMGFPDSYPVADSTLDIRSSSTGSFGQKVERKLTKAEVDQGWADVELPSSWVENFRIQYQVSYVTAGVRSALSNDNVVYAYGEATRFNKDASRVRADHHSVELQYQYGGAELSWDGKDDPSVFYVIDVLGNVHEADSLIVDGVTNRVQLTFNTALPATGPLQVFYKGTSLRDAAGYVIPNMAGQQIPSVGSLDVQQRARPLTAVIAPRAIDANALAVIKMSNAATAQKWTTAYGQLPKNDPDGSSGDGSGSHSDTPAYNTTPLELTGDFWKDAYTISMSVLGVADNGLSTLLGKMEDQRVQLANWGESGRLAGAVQRKSAANTPGATKIKTVITDWGSEGSDMTKINDILVILGFKPEELLTAESTFGEMQDLMDLAEQRQRNLQTLSSVTSINYQQALDFYKQVLEMLSSILKVQSELTSTPIRNIT